jgi:hypothetical protein
MSTTLKLKTQQGLGSGQIGYLNNTKIENINDINELITVNVLIESKNRNWNMDKHASSYSIELTQGFKYVSSVELLDSNIPNTGYVIDHNNRVLAYKEHSHKIYIEIEKGYYDVLSLCTEITTQMNNNSKLGYVYNCSADQSKKKITISCDHDFSLLFTDDEEYIGESGTIEELVINPKTLKKELQKVTFGNKRNKYINNSIGKILGFKPKNLTDDDSYTSQNIYNLVPFEYIAVFITSGTSDTFDNLSNGAFAIANINNIINNSFQLLNVVNNGNFIKYFNPPISFNKLRIEFRTSNGDLYHFHGLDNYLLLQITELFHNKKITQLNQIKY